jgi:hypothetical protein
MLSRVLHTQTHTHTHTHTHSLSLYMGSPMKNNAYRPGGAIEASCGWTAVTQQVKNSHVGFLGSHCCWELSTHRTIVYHKIGIGLKFVIGNDTWKKTSLASAPALFMISTASRKLALSNWWKTCAHGKVRCVFLLDQRTKSHRGDLYSHQLSTSYQSHVSKSSCPCRQQVYPLTYLIAN